MMQEKLKEIRDLLTEVKYPGTSKNIVELDMVQNIRIEGEKVLFRLLLIYELPDTVKQKVTEAEAYSTVWDIQMRLQHALPRSVVYYGQDTLKDGGTRYDELGVFLPLEHFADRLERHMETATKIVYGE